MHPSVIEQSIIRPKPVYLLIAIAHNVAVIPREQETKSAK
jgi:hypothetical protein